MIILRTIIIFIIVSLACYAHNPSDGRICNDASCRMCESNHLRAGHGIDGWKYSNPWSVHKAIHNNQTLPKPLITPRLPFDPTPQNQVAKLVEIVQPKSTDIFYDPGCGDGRLLIALCKNSLAKGVGCEINPKIAQLARDNVKKAGLSKQIQIWNVDSRLVKLDKATLIVCYLFPDLLKQLNLQNYTQVLSYIHQIPNITGEHIGKWWFYHKE